MSTLKTQTANAIAYTLDLLSFLFLAREAGSRVKAIYLFGSAVRGELEPESDIDLFIESSLKDEEKVKRLADSAIFKFTSSRDYQKWKLFKFTYPFTVQVGRLAEWDLKLSIASEGILLYSKEHPVFPGERKVLFTIRYPPSKKGYISLRRRLFGRDEPEYREQGLLHDFRGTKLGSHVFLIPKEEQSRMMEILGKEKVIFSMKEIMVLEG